MSIARALTQGELRYANGIFGASIDYTRVKVHNETAYFFQPDDTAITPNGEVYFPPKEYLADFSGNANSMAWLIHELVHVWQHQHGMWVRVQGAIFRTYAYGNLAGTTKAFAAYRIEQQASIVEDYFRLSNGLAARRGSGSLDDYRRIIPFLPRARQ